MEKPLSMRIREVKENIVGALNDSGLPAYILADAVRPIFAEVESLAEKQSEEEAAKYKETEE